MKCFKRETFVIVTFAYFSVIVTGGPVGLSVRDSASNDESIIRPELAVDQLNTDPINETKDSDKLSSQLMPFFYVGDVDQTGSSDKKSPSSVENIPPKMISKDIRSMRQRDTSTKSSTITSLGRNEPTTDKVSLLVPLASTSLDNPETRRLFTDNDGPILAQLGSKPPSSYNYLWYLPSISSSSSPYGPYSGYVPMFKYNSMIGKSPAPNFIGSGYHQGPTSFHHSYSLYHPLGSSAPLGYSNYPIFPSPSNNDIEDIDQIDDDEIGNMDYVNKRYYSLPYSPLFSSAPPSLSHQRHRHNFRPRFTNMKPFGQPYANPSMVQHGPRPNGRGKSFHSPSNGVLHDPDIDQLLSTFDLESKIMHKEGKHYNPKKSYDDMPMNGKYFEKKDRYKSSSSHFDEPFDDPFMGKSFRPTTNIGRYGARSDFKPYFEPYHKGFKATPYQGKGFVRSKETP